VRVQEGFEAKTDRLTLSCNVTLTRLNFLECLTLQVELLRSYNTSVIVHQSAVIRVVQVAKNNSSFKTSCYREFKILTNFIHTTHRNVFKIGFYYASYAT
jgi:hypothetical protein